MAIVDRFDPIAPTHRESGMTETFFVMVIKSDCPTFFFSLFSSFLSLFFHLVFLAFCVWLSCLTVEEENEYLDYRILLLVRCLLSAVYNSLDPLGEEKGLVDDASHYHFSVVPRNVLCNVVFSVLFLHSSGCL